RSAYTGSAKAALSRRCGPMCSNAAVTMPTSKHTKSPGPVDAAVGRNVRLWRMARGLSQGQLAGRLGVTFQQLQKYEVGGNRIPTGRIVRLANVLRVPIAALFDGTDAADPSRSPLALVADTRSFRLAHAFAVIKESKM